jgi:sugar phosphate isomerase/epimerase
LAAERRFDQQIELLHDLIQKCRILDTDIIRVFSFWKQGPLTDEVWKKMVDSYREPLNIAKKENVILALENEHSCYIGTGAEAGRLVKKINHPNMKIIWDPGNAFCAGEVPYPGGYAAVKDNMIHVHIKDPRKNTKTGKFEFCVVGEGELDYKNHLMALAKDFSGVLSLETHFIPEGGVQEQGTIACMKSLKKMVSEIK